MTIKIPRYLAAELFTHAFEDDPNECCGLLFGNGDEADEVRRMTNVNSKPEVKYTMDSGELFEAQDAARNSGRELVAIYHSHTLREAYPSVIDVANAIKVASISTTHVIVSLVEKTQPVIRAFRINGNSEVTELVVETGGEPHSASDQS